MHALPGGGTSRLASPLRCVWARASTMVLGQHRQYLLADHEHPTGGEAAPTQLSPVKARLIPGSGLKGAPTHTGLLLSSNSFLQCT